MLLCTQMTVLPWRDRKKMRKKHKKKGIMDFRNHGYVSPMTGTKAPPHHTPWVEALDDSLESYLKI